MQVHRPHFPVPPSAPNIPDEVRTPSSLDSHSYSVDQTIHTPPIATQTFRHYELLEVLGEGQFGTVWKAKDQRLDRIVAIKLPHLATLNDQRRSLFLREARAAAMLEHPHIVRVHSVEQDGDQLGIVSQYIEGRTLHHLLQDSRLSFDECARLLAAVAEAVHYAHEAGVIHRDLKPSNILVDVDGQPHVSDFGLAKWSGEQSMLTKAGLVLGTPAYMSPEQARGDSHKVDRRSDVYSLGVLLYEMLTGNPPFDGSSTLLLHQIQSEDPLAPRAINQTIPGDLEIICLKCLAKDPQGRYSTARELADDLRRFLDGDPIRARPVSLAERCVRWSRRNPVMTASLVLSVLSTIAAVSLGMLILSQPTANPTVAIPAALQPPQPVPVSLTTDPPNARIVLYPIDETTGEPRFSHAIRPEATTPINLPLLPGDYLVVAALDEGRFHEVYRHVPGPNAGMPEYYPHRNWEFMSDRSVRLFPITIPPPETDSEMTLLQTSATSRADADAWSLDSFLLDRNEVTVADFLRKFQDQLPLSLRGRRDLLSSPNIPITGLFFDEAMMYAEMVGKRLPTSLEYEFAATNGWTTRFPWGDTEPPSDAWRLTSTNHQTFDRTLAETPIWGLFSNASEFVLPHKRSTTSSGAITPPILPSLRDVIVVQGGPTSANSWIDHPRSTVMAGRLSLLQQVGFRCAKSHRPRL